MNKEASRKPQPTGMWYALLTLNDFYYISLNDFFIENETKNIIFNWIFYLKIPYSVEEEKEREQIKSTLFRPLLAIIDKTEYYIIFISFHFYILNHKLYLIIHNNYFRSFFLFQ